MQFKIKQGVFESNRIIYIRTSEIYPNPNQPRRLFDDKSLAELTDSIRQFGIIQPLTIRRGNGSYELIAGERRLRAAKIALMEKVPCIIVDVEDSDSSLIALIENLQRKDLGFIEEAEGIARLISHYHMSQEAAAKKLGKSQSAIANKLRLLKHPDEFLDIFRQQELTERHARALLRVTDLRDRRKILNEILKRELNVAQTEALIDRYLDNMAMSEKQKRHTYVIKDVRVFVNTIKNALTLMQNAGVNADMGRDEDEENITLTIKIPKTSKSA